MMRIRNKSVIYTGKVGAKMRPKRPPLTGKRKYKKLVKLLDGPFRGHSLSMDAAADLSTFVFAARGAIGRYKNGCWVHHDSY